MLRSIPFVQPLGEGGVSEMRLYARREKGGDDNPLFRKRFSPTLRLRYRTLAAGCLSGSGLRRFAAIIGISVWWLPITLHSRLEQPPSTVDLTRLVSEAPIIFIGVVLNVSVMQGRQLPLAAVGQLRVQR